MSDHALIRDVFNKQLVQTIAYHISYVYSPFEHLKFSHKASSFSRNDSFKSRANCIANALIQFLPNNFLESALIIRRCVEKIEIKSNNWENFIFMPFAIFVEKKGCQRAFLHVSMDLLKEITKRFTSEFAIRSFIVHYPDETLSILKEWTQNNNHHVRRLVSEGLRPRLPWAQVIHRFIKHPEITLDILELLKDDNSKYVQKSVANHLNDITKDNPEIALNALEKWKKENRPNTNWIVKHALRSELKKGNKKALEIAGYSLSPNIEVSDFKLSSSKIKIGDYILFQFTIRNIGSHEEQLMIDYICHFMKSNGRTAPKTFKLRTKSLKEGQSIHFKKKHSLQIRSTRKIYPGKHRIELFINGISFKSNTFFITP